MKYRVAMIDYDYTSLEIIEQELAKHDVQLDARNCATIEEAMEFARDANGVIVQKLGPVDGKFMDSLTKCKVIARTGIGLDPIDVPAATERGIAVAYVPSYCENEVADHAMSLLLACARKVTQYDRSVKSGVWDFNIGAPIHRLSEQTIGLLGLGKIPQKVLPRAKGFGLRVIAHDPYVSEEQAKALDVELVSFDELLAQSDYISLHVPLTDSTKGIMGADSFAKMKNTAFLINTARGPLVNEKELAQALRAGEIAGAGLDVRENEAADPDHELNQFDNVILSPHAGYYSLESLVLLQVLFARYTGMVLNGEKPEGIANPEVLGA